MTRRLPQHVIAGRVGVGLGWLLSAAWWMWMSVFLGAAWEAAQARGEGRSMLVLVPFAAAMHLAALLAVTWVVAHSSLAGAPPAGVALVVSLLLVGALLNYITPVVGLPVLLVSALLAVAWRVARRVPAGVE